MGMFDDVLENVGEPFKGGNGFDYGTHAVVIGEVKSLQKKVKNNPEAEIIEVVVFDPKDNDKTATCTLYFHTEGGAKMAVTKVLGILVHNAGEDKKETVRKLGKELFSKIDDPTKARDVAFKLMSEKMIGKKAYLVAEPQGKYKTTGYGDIWHYPAEPQSADERADAAVMPMEGEPVPLEDTPDFPEGL